MQVKSLSNEQLLLAKEILDVRISTLFKGDESGHAFHGNQWTGGEGIAAIGSAANSYQATQPAAAPDPRYLNQSTPPFIGSNVVTNGEPGAEELNQIITLPNGGSVGLLFLQKKLVKVTMPNGDTFYYNDDNSYTLYNKTFPEGLIFTNNGLVPEYHPSFQLPFDIFWPDKKKSALVKGDVAGHDFHGNQWTGGEGGENIASPEHQSAVEQSLTHGPSYQGWNTTNQRQLEESKMLADKLRNDGGFTFPEPKSGYVVATAPEKGVIIDGFATPREIRDYAQDNPGTIGGWFNQGKSYLDSVSVVHDRDQAIALGREHHQLAIWDVLKQEEIQIGHAVGELGSILAHSAIDQALNQPNQAQLGLAVEADVVKGDVAGHEFHGNQWTGGKDSTREDYGPGQVFEGPKYARVNTRLYDDMTKFDQQTGGKYHDQIRANAVWTGSHEDKVRGNIEKDKNRYKEPEKLISLGRHIGIAHGAGGSLTGQQSYKTISKYHDELHQKEKSNTRIGQRAEPGKVVSISSYGQPYSAWIPHEHDSVKSADIIKYAPEPGDFEATWNAESGDDNGPCPGCQDAADSGPYDNPYDVPDPTEVCFAMNGTGKNTGMCNCTITINGDDENEIDAVDYDAAAYDVSGKFAEAILTKGDVSGHAFHGNQYTGGSGRGTDTLTPEKVQETDGHGGVRSYTYKPTTNLHNVNAWISPKGEFYPVYVNEKGRPAMEMDHTETAALLGDKTGGEILDRLGWIHMSDSIGIQFNQDKSPTEAQAKVMDKFFTEWQKHDPQGGFGTNADYKSYYQDWMNIEGNMKAAALVKGDVGGHDFHGNQWTGGMGGEHSFDKKGAPTPKQFESAEKKAAAGGVTFRKGVGADGKPIPTDGHISAEIQQNLQGHAIMDPVRQDRAIAIYQDYHDIAVQQMPNVSPEIASSMVAVCSQNNTMGPTASGSSPTIDMAVNTYNALEANGTYTISSEMASTLTVNGQAAFPAMDSNGHDLMGTPMEPGTYKLSELSPQSAARVIGAGLCDPVNDCVRMYRGESPNDVITSPKLRNFATNIALTSDKTAVTCDRWAARSALIGPKTSFKFQEEDKEKGIKGFDQAEDWRQTNNAAYAILSENIVYYSSHNALNRDGSSKKVLPLQAQAITWPGSGAYTNTFNYPASGNRSLDIAASVVADLAKGKSVFPLSPYENPGPEEVPEAIVRDDERIAIRFGLGKDKQVFDADIAKGTKQANLNVPRPSAELIADEVVKPIFQKLAPGQQFHYELKLWPLSKLIPTEARARKYIDPKLIEALRKGESCMPGIVTKDGYILDGHHRYYAALDAGRTGMWECVVSKSKSTPERLKEKSIACAKLDADEKKSTLGGGKSAPTAEEIEAQREKIKDEHQEVMVKKDFTTTSGMPTEVPATGLQPYNLGPMGTVPTNVSKPKKKKQNKKNAHDPELVKGDTEGHEFHGNQWTGGLGAAANEFANDPVAMGALKAYTGNDYSVINGPLRGNAGWMDPTIVAQGKDEAREIDKLMARSTMTSTQTVYRGMGTEMFQGPYPLVGSDKQFDLKSIVGKTFTDNGFVSTTKSLDEARGWDFKGAVAKITVPAGTHAIDVDAALSGNQYSQSGSEHEILLNRGLTFRVIKVRSIAQPSEGLGAPRFTKPLIYMEVVNG